MAKAPYKPNPALLKIISDCCAEVERNRDIVALFAVRKPKD